MTMSFLENLCAPGTIERLGWMLVHVLWQATAVALLLAILLRLLRRASANVRYGAACSALVLMVVLPLATMRYLKTPGPVAEAGPASVAAILPPVTEGATPQRSFSVLDSGYAPSPEDTLKANLSVPPTAHVPEPMTPVPLRERIASALEPALPYVVLGWLIGVFGLSAWHLGGWTQLQRLKRRMVRKIGAPLQRRLEELSIRLGLHRAVGLLESALVEVPTVVGWLRPVILLPASALTGLRPEQLEAILAHELAHIRRYDYLVNMLQTVVEILGFYHPAIWWVSHRIREERENCCDDLAVDICGSSLQYAKALACMEEIRHGGTDLAVAATGGSLMARIARLLGRPAVEDRRFAWLPGLIALLLIVALVISAALTLGAGNQPPSSTNTQEIHQTPRQEHEAQAASARPSSESTATQADEKEADTGRADAAAPNAPDQMGEVLLKFKTVKVWSDLRPDRETLLLLANALGVESPLARELGRPARQLDMTLGEILRRYIAPQSLSQPAAQALLDLLHSRGYLDILSAPNMIAQDGKQAQIRITTNEHFWMPSRLERIWYGMAMDVTPHLTDDNRVALDLMVELRDPAPGTEDSNQPKVSRTIAETSMIAPEDRYLIWAAMEQAADQSDADKGRPSLYIMVKPTILQPARRDANAADDRKPTHAHRRQILLDVRRVTMERDALLNLNVEWGWPTVKAGVLPGNSTGTNTAASSTWPYGVQIGYTPDSRFTDSLLAALDQLQKNGQAEVSGQQILAQDRRKCRIQALTEEWYTVPRSATRPSPQSRPEAHKAETGTVVTITPHVGDNGDITLAAGIEVSTSLPRARGTDLPLITRRTAKNAVTIKDGGTVAVAGLAENPTGPNDKSAHETAIFVTVRLVPDANEAPTQVPPAVALDARPQPATSPSDQQRDAEAVQAKSGLQTQAEADRTSRINELMAHAKAQWKQQQYEAALGQLEALLALDPLHDEALTLKLMVQDMISLRKQIGLGGQHIERVPGKPPFPLEPEDIPVHKQLDTEVDLSELTPTTPLTMAIDVLRKCVEPPLNIVVGWRGLRDTLNVEPTSPINMTGSEKVKLGRALETLMKTLSNPVDKAKQVDFRVNKGAIIIGTAASLPQRVTDLGVTAHPFPQAAETRRFRLSYIPAPRAKALLSPVFAPYVQVEPTRTQDPNDEGNTLIVTAPPTLIDRIVADLKEIDRPRRQVLLDARVVVIEPNEPQNLGLEWSRPPVPSMALSPSTPPETIVPPLGHAPDRAATDSLMMALNLLWENGKADIIANPKVVALDGRQAQMKVIQEQWFMMTVPPDDDSYVMRDQLQKVESGTVMMITPRVGDHNDITLEMAVEVSDSIPKARGSDRPLITRRMVKNAVTVKDGGTVAVAGLAKDLSKSREKRAPGLADSPLLGELFKNHNNGKPGREVAVFVTAHLVPDAGGMIPPAPESTATVIRVPPPTKEAALWPEDSDRSEAPAPTANEEQKKPPILIDVRFVSADERLLQDLRGPGAIRGVTSPEETEALHEMGRRLSEGKSLVLTDKQTGLLMKATQQYRDCRMLAWPHAAALENEPLSFWIGSKIPYTAGYEEPGEPADQPKPRQTILDSGWKLDATVHLVGPNEVKLNGVFRMTTLLGFDRKKYQGRYSYQVPRTEDVVFALNTPIVPSGGTSVTVGPKARRNASDKPQTTLILVTPSITEGKRSAEATAAVIDPR